MNDNIELVEETAPVLQGATGALNQRLERIDDRLFSIKDEHNKIHAEIGQLRGELKYMASRSWVLSGVLAAAALAITITLAVARLFFTG